MAPQSRLRLEVSVERFLGIASGMSAHASDVATYRYNPVFVVGPFAFWTLSVLCDVATHLTGGSELLLLASYRIITLGIVMAIGLALWSALNVGSFRGTGHDSEVALTHEALLLGSTFIAILSLFWREVASGIDHASFAATGLSLVAIAMVAVSLALQSRQSAE